VLGNLELGAKTLVVVAVLVGIRAVLWALGVEGMSPTALSAGIITGGVFVLGLVVAGTLSDYRDADRAPTDLAAGLYSILREAASMHAVWSAPDMGALRRRLIALVTTLRPRSTTAALAPVRRRSRNCRRASSSSTSPTSRPITSSACGPSRPGCASPCCASTVSSEEFLPSAYALIVWFIALILVLLMFTNFDGLAESLVTVGFLSFFFLALLQLLSVISTPSRSGASGPTTT
jgi:hypothetical protein